MNRALLALALSSCSLAAQAAPWSGEVGLGYLGTSGNSETTSLNGKLALDYVNGPWKNAFTASAINSSSDDEGSTAERYTVGNKLDWGFTERDYVFGVVEWEKDLFGGVRERTSEAVGYGRHILTGPVHLLDAEIGAGARQLQNNDPGRTREDDMIGRAFAKYQWTLTETSAFIQSLKVESGADNTFTESVTELKLSVVGNLFASLSYTIKNNSEVPAGTESTDTFAAVNLSYAFGKDK
jgi:putative salt-induced outer membrane protein